MQKIDTFQLVSLKCQFTHKVYPVFSQPMEALEEKQQGEKGHKARGKIIPEDCKG